MKKSLTILAFAASVIACAPDGNSEMREFLSRQDMHWTEIQSDADIPGPDRPTNWKGANKKGYFSGALMGNGLIGTNMYKAERPNTYRINVGRSDVTEQRDGYDLCKKGRLAIGYFTLATAGKVIDEKMDLSIYDAETTGTFTTDKGSIAFVTYVHALEDYIVFESKATGGETDYEWDFVPFKAISPRVPGRPDLKVPSWYVNAEGKANPDAYRADRGDVCILIQPLAKDTTFTDIARYYAVAWKEAAKGSARRVIATVSFEDTEEKAIDKAVAVIGKGFAESPKSLRKSHREWWHDFYKDVAFLTFPDPQIERYYWMQYYKFASTARPGKPIVDLQGVWPTWDTIWPAIWMNLNIQLTYSFLSKANMGAFAQPLWDSLWEHRDNLGRNVTDVPGQEDWTDAACLGRTCSYDLHDPLYPSSGANRYEAGNLCWTLFYWYQQCVAYGDDEAMRDKLFPLLKSAVNLFFHIRITHPDGTYSLPATASPEYPVDNVGPNTNYDLANLRQALIELIEIDGKFGINDPMLPQWKDFLANMPDFQYSESTGFKVSETTEFIYNNHRHYSHLFMIYPYHMLDWNNPAERAKANLSIDHWVGDQGYSRTGKAAMLASEGLGDRALEQMEVFVNEFLKPNTLYCESSTVIETPLAGASTLHDFYMQDWGDRLRIFYGCPSSWSDASFKRMRAAGAFLVAAERKDGRTVRVEVFSEKGNTCRVQTDILPDRLSVTCNGKPVSFELLPCSELGNNGSLIEFSTDPATTIVIAEKI